MSIEYVLVITRLRHFENTRLRHLTSKLTCICTSASHMDTVPVPSTGGEDKGIHSVLRDSGVDQV